MNYSLPKKELDYEELDNCTKDQGGAKKIIINMPPLHTIEDVIKYRQNKTSIISSVENTSTLS